ncbi:hypothetical protein SDC9_192790 [bioreactor metagenome]|uniref:Uncharacterized protein n=1 Tax=bioreactor metagenome TaxID=1076179 RepID=A0A645ICR2_9ZZZZ
MVGADIEHNRVVGMKSQQAFVAFVGLKHQRAATGAEIARQTVPGKCLDQAAVHAFGIGAEMKQRFGQERGG